MASIAASLTLYFTSFFTSQDKRKSLSFGSVAATTLLVTGLYATYPENVTASAPLLSFICWTIGVPQRFRSGFHIIHEFNRTRLWCCTKIGCEHVLVDVKV